MQNSSINVGIIGCGYWGPNYARVFNELSMSNVTNCCDIDEEKLHPINRLYPLVKTTTDYKAVLDDHTDAVVISTPASTHYEIAKHALLNGKHVLVEKPMTLDPKESEDLCKIAREMNKVLMVGHVYIYHPAIAKIKEFLSANLLGRIYYIHLIRTGLGPIRKDVNVLWDLAPHDVSIALYLLDSKPTHVLATGATYLQKGLEDVATVTLFFQNNVVVFLHVSWLDAVKTRKLSIVGSDKMLVFDDVESLERLKIFDKKVSYPGAEGIESYGEFRLSLREGDVHIPKVEPTEPLKVMCQHFIDNVLNGGKVLTDGKNGLEVINILHAAQQSLENKGSVIKIS